MPEFFPLYDLKARPLYLACGRVDRYRKRLVGGDGIKASIKQFYLLLQIVSPIKRRVPVLWQSVAERLKAAFGSDLRAAFLLDTNWYKSTKCVGFIETMQTSYFVKMHNDPEECFFEEGQSRFVRDHFGGSFVTAPVIENIGNILLFRNLEYVRSVDKNDHVEEKLLDITSSFLKNSRIEKTIRDSVPLDMMVMLHKSDYASIGDKIRSWISENQERTIQTIPVHGDATPWNMFVTDDDKIALVDYERAGWNVAYYDAFHYLLQDEALKGNKSALRRILYKRPWFQAEGMHYYLTLYLIDQLYHDLNDHLKKGFSHPHLMNLIKMKIYWLEYVLNGRR